MNNLNANWLMRHKLLSILIVICTILALVISLKSVIITYYLRDFFKQHANDIAIQELTLNIYQSDFTIKGLETRHANGQQLNINSLYVDWEFDGLFDNHITITKFELDGVTLDIQSDAFVPVQIGPLLLEKFQSATTPEEQAETTEPWAITINDVDISNLRVCLDDLSVLYQEIGLPLTKELEPLGVCLTTDAIEIDGAFNLDKSQQISYDEDIQIRGLAVSASENEPILKLTSLAIEDLSLTSSQVSFNQTTLSTLSLLAETNTQTHATLGLSLEELTIGSTATSFEFNDLTMTEVSLEKLVLRSPSADKAMRPLVAIESLALSNLSKQQNDISFAELTLNNTGLQENYANPGENTPYITTIGSIQISDFALAPSEISLKSIKLADLTNLTILTEQGINANNWFTPPEQEEATIAESNEPDQSDPITIAIGELQLESGAIRILESRSKNQIQHQLQDINISVNNFNTGNSSELPASEFSYELLVGENGKLTGEGTFRANLENPAVDLKGKIATLNLVNVSYLAARYIGYRIDRGLLSVDYNLVIKDQKVDAELKTLFEKFALANLEEDEKNPLNEDLGLPLPLALNLLRDSDDNIELDLPITGDVNSPDFSVSSIVSTVMVKAIKNAVILNYSPLGMLTLASGVIDLATALKFEPIVFNARSTEFDANATERMVKVITLMQEKPKVKMIICGVATQADAPEQQAVEISTETQAIGTGDSPPAVQPIVDPMALINIAKQRQDLVIDYIIKNGNIAKQRLVGCNVKVSKNKAAKPVVEISI